MTESQVAAIVHAATFLDFAAGEGMGMPAQERMGRTLWADDIVMDLAEAFGIEWGDDFGQAVRKVLEKADD